jgi:hypothetical protein
MYHRSGGAGYLKPMFRRAFVTEHALSYDETLRIAEDWTFAAEALARGGRYFLLAEPLYRYAIHANSTSHRIKADVIQRLVDSANTFVARHGAKLSAEDRSGLEARRSALLDALAFQSFVDGLKARDVLGGISALAARPSAWPLLRLPIQARLSGKRGGRELVQ